MWRLLSILALLLSATIAQAQNATTPWIFCDATVIYDAATSGSTQLVAGVTNTSIYVCGYSFFAAGTVNVELDYGTGAACVTNNTKIVPAYEFTTQTGFSDQSAQYRGLKAPLGTSLCLKTNAAIPVQAIVYYRQYRGP